MVFRRAVGSTSVAGHCRANFRGRDKLGRYTLVRRCKFVISRRSRGEKQRERVAKGRTSPVGENHRERSRRLLLGRRP